MSPPSRSIPKSSGQNWAPLATAPSNSCLVQPSIFVPTVTSRQALASEDQFSRLRRRKGSLDTENHSGNKDSGIKYLVMYRMQWAGLRAGEPWLRLSFKIISDLSCKMATEWSFMQPWDSVFEK